MNSLKKLIEAKKNKKLIPNENNEDLNNKYISEEQSTSVAGRKRVYPFDNDEKVFKEKFVDETLKKSLSCAYNILEDLNEPLKEFGEDLDEIILRAKQIQEKNLKTKLNAFEFTCYNDIPKNFNASHFVLAWIKTSLNQWRDCLNNNKPIWGEEMTTETAAKLYRNSLIAFEPLIILLYNGSLDQNLLEQLKRIAENCINHDFEAANNLYMELAIGDSAWPIGVTMVGIHARASRGRIEADKIKHLLKNENTRMYMQVIKRLLRFHENMIKNNLK